MTKLKDQARSIGTKLSNLARELGVGYLQVLTEFLLERLTVRLVGQDKLADKLVFKGGYVSLRVYESPRYTVDLDALLKRGNLEELITLVQAAAESDINDGVWFRLEKTVDLQTQGEYGGLRLVFRVGIGEVLSNLKKAQVVNLDIGKGDPVVPGPSKVETAFLLGGGKFSWSVYPAETVVAEKFHALISRGSNSSRAKDIFDLNLFLPKCDPENLKKALKETFHHRGENLPANLASHLQNIDRSLLKMGWISAVGAIADAPTFDECFDSMVKQVNKIFPG